MKLISTLRERWRRPPRPINVVNGVTMPEVADRRWKPTETRSVQLGDEPIWAHVATGDFGDSWAFLMVDGVRWEGADVECYAREVVRIAVERQSTQRMERSREVARRAVGTS